MTSLSSSSVKTVSEDTTLPQTTIAGGDGTIQKGVTNIVGTTRSILIGRSSACQVQIGKRNLQISRSHLRIDYNRALNRYEATVLGMNGIEVIREHHPPQVYAKNAHVILEHRDQIIIVGEQLQFLYPSFDQQEEIKKRPHSPLLLHEKELKETTRHQRPEAKETELPHPVKQEELTYRQVDEVPTTSIIDITDMIIEAMVFSKKTSMSIPEIYTQIMNTNPTLLQQKPKKDWLQEIHAALHQPDTFFGQVPRFNDYSLHTTTTTITAAAAAATTTSTLPSPRSSPPLSLTKDELHHQLYYYDSSKDPVEWRQATYAELGRTTRRSTLRVQQRGGYYEEKSSFP